MTAVALGVPSVRHDAGDAPVTGPLVDTHGRVATDLRVSLTDRCNLRCTYCMPADGLQWLPKDELLSHDEMARLLRIAVTRLGITSVRFTGGEPLVSPELERTIASAAALAPRPEIAMTTNGIGLGRRAAALKAAGLDRVNVSLDTLDADRFHRITRRDRLAAVLDGLAGAAAAGLAPVKVNAVLDPRTGLDDAVTLLRFCLDHDYQLRIIEQMPLDAEHRWQRDEALTADRILAALRRSFDVEVDPAPRGSAPAQSFRVRGPGRSGTVGTLGIVASVSQAFCSACDRTRLTADGQVRSCLFATTETDLRGLLRRGADDATVELAWRAAMWSKPAGHGINDPAFMQPSRPMSAIGG